MSEFAERRKIDQWIHPEKQYAPPGLFGPDPKPFWEQPEHLPDPNGMNTKDGSSARYLQNVADGNKDPNFDANKKLGSLVTKDERFRAINEMASQNGEGGEEQCGAYVLLAGAVVGGGNKGVLQLMDSVEAYNKKHPGSLDPKALAADQEEFKKLRDKLAKGEELTAGDLNMVAGNVYDMMKVESKDGSGDAGTKRARVDELFRESPEMRKMWKENELSYDSISTTGAKQGGHAVLGIGHGKSDKDHTGQHEAIYDPYRRTEKDPEAHQKTIDAMLEIDRLKEFKKGTSNPDLLPAYDERIKEAERAYQDAMKKEAASKKNLGQVVTDPYALGMYRNAARETMEMTDKGPKTKSLQETPLPERNPYAGMY